MQTEAAKGIVESVANDWLREWRPGSPARSYQVIAVNREGIADWHGGHLYVQLSEHRGRNTRSVGIHLEVGPHLTPESVRASFADPLGEAPK